MRSKFWLWANSVSVVLAVMAMFLVPEYRDGWAFSALLNLAAVWINVRSGPPPRPPRRVNA